MLLGTAVAAPAILYRLPKFWSAEGIAAPMPAAAVPQSAPVDTTGLTRFSVDQYCDGTVRGNTAGMKALADAVMKARGGVISFTPRKEYVVGVQAFAPNHFGVWQFSRLLEISGCTKAVVIQGNGARIKFANGLRFGTFDPKTGKPTRNKQPFYDERQQSFPAYTMIGFSDNKGPIVLQDIELDGNAGAFIYGGPFGDTGWQLPADGLVLTNNTGGIRIENVRAHHFPRDGAQILDKVTPGSRSARAVFTNVAFENNGRQGLSVVGGRGYRFVNCKFNGTGFDVPQRSAPTAGVDMEQESGIIRDIEFINSEFVGNYGPATLAVGDVADVRYEGCSLSGPGWAFWVGSAVRTIFEKCTFTGSGTNGGGNENPALATRFVDCLFTDNPRLMPKGVTSFASAYVPDLGGGSINILFDRCRWDMTSAKAGLPYTYSNTIYRDCTMKNTAGPSVTLGRYLGNNVVTGPANLAGAVIVGRVLLNGRLLPRS
ncbi:MAG TPA: hypothetical protein VF662_01260 [Allosphingosinicella sp.]